MTDYYCHACAATRGLGVVNLPSNLTGSAQQLTKFVKHTVVDANEKLQSVLASPDYDSFKELMVSTAASGSVEIDDKGRRNIIIWCGTPRGLLYSNGALQFPQDGFKVVIPDNPVKVHGFPTGSVEFRAAKCSDCGTVIGC